MLGVFFGQILFFQFANFNLWAANENNHIIVPWSHAISRHVCFGGKRTNATDSSITFLSLVVKISSLLATLCFGVIYLVTNNHTFTNRTSSPVPWFWKIGTRQILPSLPRQDGDISRFQNGGWGRFVVVLPSCENCGHFRPFLDLFWSIFQQERLPLFAGGMSELLWGKRFWEMTFVALIFLGKVVLFAPSQRGDGGKLQEVFCTCFVWLLVLFLKMIQI